MHCLDAVDESLRSTLQHVCATERVVSASRHATSSTGNAHMAAARADGTDTTPLQWGLACIRSRAFQLTRTLFAAVPFADLANHSSRPNARLQPALDAPDAVRTGTADNWVALVATEDIPAGSEVTVSYTGSAGATNRRLLVQYGFVLPGNENDRFDFELFEGYVGTTPLRGAPCAPPTPLALPLLPCTAPPQVGRAARCVLRAA